ncbi:MAG: hypothetical protein ACK4NS_00595 [Saprospiraceae bacterium]
MASSNTLFNSDNLDARSLEFLVLAIEKNNLPGFDYYEFKRSVSALMRDGLDEAVAYKSAFTTAAQVGLTKEKLIETANYYRDVIGKEKSHFESALNEQTAQKVLAKESEIKRLQDQIDRNKAEIARLQDEIGGYLNQIEQATTSRNLESEKLQKAHKAFEQTHAAVLLQMDQDIERIHRIL